jgi:predicted nucleic acid-binding protein
LTLVIDTGVLVAAVRRDEPEHEACRSLLAETTERRVVPAPVVVEVDYHLRGTAAWFALLHDVEQGGLTVADTHPGDYARVAALQEQYTDLRVGFVDCAVLAAVERLGEDKLATLDHRHFTVLRPRHVAALRLLPD